MEMIYKDAIRQHIDRRMEWITAPCNYSCGYMTLEEEEARLGELADLANAVGLCDKYEEIKKARQCVRDQIDEVRRRRGEKPIYSK